MKIFNRFLAFTIAIVAFSFVNVNAQALSNGPVIEQKIFKKILSLPRYEVYDHIGFTFNNGVVTLSGKVLNAVNKSSAENVVEDIPGVTSVINNIEILPPSRFDDDIRRGLYARLSNSGGLSGYLWPVNPDVRLIVDNGHITLEGNVRNRGDYNMMNIIARGVPGSFTVTNNLKIENDPS
jgi:Predicted periplasmic or secreted lipoprotein